MATYPSGVKTFTTRVNGDTITAGFFNDIHDEVTAIETFLRSTLFTAVTSAGIPNWQTYTPTWTNGSIGNGTLTGRYLDMGTMQFISISMTAGSTTTFGAGGAWAFSLPGATTGENGNLTALCLDGATPYVGTAYLASSTTLSVVAITPTTTGFVTNAHPFSWATGDILLMAGILFKS